MGVRLMEIFVLIRALSFIKEYFLLRSLPNICFFYLRYLRIEVFAHCGIWGICGIISVVVFAVMRYLRYTASAVLRYLRYTAIENSRIHQLDL